MILVRERQIDLTLSGRFVLQLIDELTSIESLVAIDLRAGMAHNGMKKGPPP